MAGMSFSGSSSISAATAADAAYSQAMAAATDLPEGSHFDINVSVASASADGNYIATATLTVSDNEAGNLSPFEALEDAEDSIEEKDLKKHHKHDVELEHEREHDAEVLAAAVLAERALDSQMAEIIEEERELIGQPGLEENLHAQWHDFAEPHYVPDIPQQHLDDTYQLENAIMTAVPDMTHRLEDVTETSFAAANESSLRATVEPIVEEIIKEALLETAADWVVDHMLEKPEAEPKLILRQEPRAKQETLDLVA